MKYKWQVATRIYGAGRGWDVSRKQAANRLRRMRKLGIVKRVDGTFSREYSLIGNRNTFELVLIR